VFWWVPEEEQ
jgi:hypothetical protein